MRGTNILIRRRLALVFFLTVVVFAGLICRLAWIQFVKGDELKNKATELRMRDIPVEARRGDIVDCNGNQLVTSISVDSIYAIPNQVENPRQVAADLSNILDMDEDRLYKKLTKKSAFEWIKRKVDIDTSQKIKELDFNGIKTVEENERYYLHDNLASHLLGFTGIDNQGLLGLEKSFDDQLRGKPGRIVVEHDAVGRKIPEATHDYKEPEPGNTLKLSLDKNLQYFVERELDNVVDKYSPKLAVAMIMDPRTGEILAMGNRPTFNPNNWKQAPQKVWNSNPAIWYTYEPGSTFKIITASAAMEVGAVEADDQFYDPGYIKVADRRIHCWKKGGHGSQTFAEVVQNSCNPGFVEIGLNLGVERFYKYIKAYGFHKETGIKLPGEERGLMIEEKEATNLNIASMSIGQSISVTPIQLITAVSAAANGGKLMQPRLVQEITGPEGETVKDFKPKVVRQVISRETSSELRSLLEKVVSQGTGKKAFVEGYRVAGKTGTAQVVGDRGYVQGKYVASFVGFAPADDPQVTILVMIAEPQGGVHTGGQVAAPVFQNIAEDTLRYLEVPQTPGLEKPKEPWETEESPAEEIEVPNVVNYPVGEAEQLLKSRGLNVQISGQGEIVRGQVPRAGATVYQGTEVILNMKPEQQDGEEKVTVPDLTGLSIKEAANVLEEVGLYMETEGSGLAAEQSIPPGKKAARGTTIKVKFLPPKEDQQ